MMITWIFGHFLAICIGISLGLIGGGGSVLAVPILVYVMGVATKPAIAMTLFIVGSVSLIGIIPHWQKGNVNFKTACKFGSATIVGAFVGAKLAALPFITGTFQLILFALIMLLAAGFMIKKSSQPIKEVAAPKIDLQLYPKPVCKYCWLWMMSEGLGVGLLTGLVGVGGGFAIVPALVLLGNTPIKQAIGTSLLIIAMNSVAGLLGYLGQVSLNWSLIASFTVAASLGTITGAYLSQFVQPRQLQRGFGYLLVAVASFILFQNRNKFYTSDPPTAYTIQIEASAAKAKHNILTHSPPSKSRDSGFKQQLRESHLTLSRPTDNALAAFTIVSKSRPQRTGKLKPNFSVKSIVGRFPSRTC